MHPQSRLAAWATAITFGLALAAPTVVASFGIADVELAEGRSLAVEPALPTTFEEARSYAERYEAYYVDSFALRGRMRLLHATWLRRGLGVSESPQVVIGEEPWLFYTKDGILEDHQGLRRVSTDEAARWRNSLEARHAYLSKRGIAYVFYVAPNKVTMHGDKLPTYMRVTSPRETRLDGIMRAFEGSEVPFFDQRPLLRQHMERERVYLMTDSHWNRVGAFESYRQIAQHLREVGAIDMVLERERFVTNMWPAFGDLGKLLTLQVDKESMPFLHAQPPLEAQRVDPKQDFKLPDELKVWEAPAFYENPKGRGRLLFIGDSFSFVQQEFYAEHFENALFVPMALMRLEDLSFLVEGLRPDVVIEERAERNMTWTPLD